MHAEPRDGELPTEVILRMLGEYSKKVATGLRRRWRFLAVLPVLVGLVGFLLTLSLESMLFKGGMLYALLAIALLFVLWVRERSELQLAVWQLRRIYELASRYEDLGSRKDFVHQLELELRLSEAQFLLNQGVGIGGIKGKGDEFLHRRPPNVDGPRI